MSNPAPGQAEGQDREAGSTHGAPVPSLQRTVQGSPVGTEFRIKARANVQAMLQQERHKHEGADRKKMLCPIDFHSKIAARHDRREAEKDVCGYCGQQWTASFAKKAIHLLGNSKDGTIGAKYINQCTTRACGSFSLEDKQQLLIDMKDAIDIVGAKTAEDRGWARFTSA